MHPPPAFPNILATPLPSSILQMGDDVLPLVESLLMTRYGAMLTVSAMRAAARVCQRVCVQLVGLMGVCPCGPCGP